MICGDYLCTKPSFDVLPFFDNMSKKLWPLHFPKKNKRQKMSYVSVCLGCYNKIPETECLSATEIISHSSGGWTTEIKVLGDSVFRACFLYEDWRRSSHCVPPGWRRWGTLWGLFSGDTNPIHDGSALPPNCLPKVSPPNTITLGIGFQWMNVGVEDTNCSSWASHPTFAKSRLKRLSSRVPNTRARPLPHCFF